MIKRTRNLKLLEAALVRSLVTALLGARQIGKTTLAMQYLRDNPGKYLDLETHADQLRLSNAEPDITLRPLRNLYSHPLLPELS